MCRMKHAADPLTLINDKAVTCGINDSERYNLGVVDAEDAVDLSQHPGEQAEAAFRNPD